MLSVALAEEIRFTDVTLTETLPVILGYVITAIVIMTVPLFFLTRQLVKAKRWGRIAYGGLGYKLSRAFDKKWGHPSDQSSGDELLKTADSSAVCDYSDIYEIVRTMRYLPINLKDSMTQAVILIVPFTPLVFTEITPKEVFSGILRALI